MSADDTLRAAIDEAIAPLIADHHAYLANPVDGIPVGRAELHYVYDQYGTRMLDFSNPLQPIGHLHPFVTEAIKEHLRYYVHTAPAGQHVLRWPVEYARNLVRSFSPDDGPERDLRVLFTEGEQAARVEANLIAQRKTKLGGLTVSLVGDDGELADPDEVAAKVVSSTGDHAVIIDESKTGFGRLGAMWGQHAYRVQADLTVLGGPVGGGMALGAVIGHRDWFDGYTPTRSAQAAAPLACAAGANTLRAINPGVVEHVKDAGTAMDLALNELVEQFPGYLFATRGMGLWRLLEFNHAVRAEEFVGFARHHGLLLSPPVGKSIILTPTLIASEQEIRRGVDLMGEVLLEWSEGSH